MAGVTTATELRTGRRPQNAILCRGVARPDLFYDSADEKMYKIPEHVPVFTTAEAMEKFMNPGSGSKRSRDDGDANLIPVIAHMEMDRGGIKQPRDGGKFIFVGISYGEASMARPSVSIATGGLMPMIQNPADNKALEVGKPAWWSKPPVKYGHGTDAINIAVLTTTAGDLSGSIEGPTVRAFCGVAVQQSTADDVGILLGVPPQTAP